MTSLFLFFLTVIAFNVLMFVPAYAFQTDKLTDISYALSFIILGAYAFIFSERTYAQQLLVGMVSLWAVRLGGFLLYRVHKKGKDKRFDGMRESFIKFLRFWVLQGESVFIILIASCLFWQTRNTTINLLSDIGILVFLGGLLIEGVADLQKWRFNQDPKNKGYWIDTGLWAYSRHPNYFGEILVWVGIYLFVYSSLSQMARIIGLISPIYIIVLLRYVSGVPILEKAADKRWGKDKDYQAYKKNVPILVPFWLEKEWDK